MSLVSILFSALPFIDSKTCFFQLIMLCFFASALDSTALEFPPSQFGDEGDQGGGRAQDPQGKSAIEMLENQRRILDLVGGLGQLVDLVVL